MVPVGTGNLLARNLEIPLSEAEALKVAFGDHTNIDLIKVTVDGGRASTSRSSRAWGLMR